MQWTSVSAEGLPDLIVFDGDCVLCSHWARWVHERDGRGRFRFVAIQSEAGRALARRFGVTAESPETNIVIVDGHAYFKFDSVLTVLSALSQKGQIGVLAHVARPVRDWLYDRVARNRYALFGRREACLAPDPAMRARLIERAADLAAA